MAKANKASQQEQAAAPRRNRFSRAFRNVAHAVGPVLKTAAPALRKFSPVLITAAPEALPAVAGVLATIFAISAGANYLKDLGERQQAEAAAKPKTTRAPGGKLKKAA